jgi:hypothetical protein
VSSKRISIDAEQAQAILEPIWERVLDAFEEYGHQEPSKAKLGFDPALHDTCRHFAGTTLDGKSVYYAPALADMPIDTIEAIMAHEAGHIVDLSNPGRWWFRGGELCFLKELPSKNLKKLLVEWSERDDDEVEHVADAIAEVCMGRRIGYIGEGGCLVQTWDKGKRRPNGLR